MTGRPGAYISMKNGDRFDVLETADTINEWLDQMSEISSTKGTAVAFIKCRDFHWSDKTVTLNIFEISSIVAGGY